MTEVWQTTLELPLTKVEESTFTIPGEPLTLTTIAIDGTWAGSLDLLTTATLNAAIASSIKRYTKPKFISTSAGAFGPLQILGC